MRITGRAFLRPVGPVDETTGSRRVMILAVVEMPATVVEGNKDYAGDIAGFESGGTLQMVIHRIKDVTRHVPRGLDASKILTSGIEAVWRKRT